MWTALIIIFIIFGSTLWFLYTKCVGVSEDEQYESSWLEENNNVEDR